MGIFDNDGNGTLDAAERGLAEEFLMNN